MDTPDDGEAGEYTGDMLNPDHDDYQAMSDERKAPVDSRVQFLAGKRVTLRFRPYLEVFHLSKLLVPGVQIQIDMYWLDRHFKYQMHNGQSLQSLFSQSCGDYKPACRIF